MADTWAALVGKLRRAYDAAGLDCGHGLRAPASDESVRRVTERLGLPVPPSLRAIWRLHGGQRYLGSGTTGLFGSHRLHSPAQAIEHHRLHMEFHADLSGRFPPPVGKESGFHPRLLPFASWDAYDLCLDTATGAVWEFHRDLTGGTSRPSLRAVVAELLALMEAGRRPQLDGIFPHPPVPAAWLTADVLAMARGIAAEGSLAGLRPLADALAEAGCDHKKMLAECRKRKPCKFGGWWVVDLLLGQG
ncbi:MAG: SMI1/KNR4 family protein [Gemmataceae bacterium]|nr:SMI1/KNR4 family protein [Gemmataceae bacterium]